MNILRVFVLAAAFGAAACSDPGQYLSGGFENPPADIQTSVYWYWISGNVSREGVVADLESMKRVGINRAFIGNIGLPENEMPHRGPVRVMSDEWFDIMHTAMKRATELGIDIGVFNSPGWSQAGGPWIEPGQSMRYLATVSAEVEGGGDVTVDLPAPSDDFEQVRVLAVPLPEGTLRLDAASARVDGPADVRKAFDGDTATALPLASGRETVIEVAPRSAFTLRTLRLYPAAAPIRATAELQAVRGGEVTVLRRFGIDRTNPMIEVGFDPYAPVTIACEPTEAEAFRLVVSGANAGSAIAEVEFLSVPLVERYSEKTLAKMHQTPLPYWHDYMWPEQPAADGAVDPASVVDVTELCTDGRLAWNAPAGRWLVLRTGMMPTGVKNGPALDDGAGLEVDKWSRKHLGAHYDAFVGELLRRIPTEDRTCWKVVVADSYEKGGQNFSDDFFEAFEARYGYDPRPWLPVFSGVTVGDRDRSDRFLWDLRRMMADRLAYDHIGGLRELAHRDGLTTWLENYGHWGFPGEFLQYGGQSDEVAGEYWSEGELGDIENRAASSCAHIYGKNKVSSESFTAGFKPFARYPYLMKQRGDRFFSEGINNTLLHVYITQAAEGPKPGMNAFFGNEFNRNNTWFDQLDLFIAYLKRCNFMLQQGLNVADVAYFIGEDVPKMTGATDPALPAGHQFDYINAEVLCRDAEVRDGRITLPHGTQYRVLVLPRQRTMRPEVLEAVERLVKEGAVVLGPAPDRSPSMEGYPEADLRVRELAAKLWGEKTAPKRVNRYGKGFVYEGYTLEEVFAGQDILPDFGVDASLPLLFGHRAMKGAEIYFVSNQSEEPVVFDASFRVEGLLPEWWQPVTGAMRDLEAYVPDGRKTTVPMRLEPLESGFVVFRKSVPCTPHAGTWSENFPQPTVVVAVEGPWTVRFEAPDGVGNFTTTLSALGDWSQSDDQRLRYFSGKATYRTAFDKPARAEDQRLWLDLGRVGVMARVRVNGAYAGGVWTPPYRVDITDFVREGSNEVEIEVVNTWVNRLIGDSRLPASERRTWCPYTEYGPDSPLQEAGLLGPVTLKTCAY